MARARRLIGTRKVGHAGTLDPMATGLLVLGVNRATRLLTHVVGLDKTYEAVIRLGQSTVTDDAEGTVTATAGADHVGSEDLERGLAGLRGPIEQVPSSVSAIKVGGVRSYARVRAGQDVELPPRPVVIRRFDVRGTEHGRAGDGTPVLDVSVVVECSSGTYIRALARDLGAELGSGGHLTQLRRTRVGPFEVSGTPTLEDLEAESGSEDPDAGSVPPPLRLATMTEVATALFPVRALTETETAAVRVGQHVTAGIEATVAGPVAAVAPDGHLVALLVRRDERAKPELVLDPA